MKFHVTLHWLELANQWLEVTRQFLWLDSTKSWLWLEGLVTLTRQKWLGNITGNLLSQKFLWLKSKISKKSGKSCLYEGCMSSSSTTCAQWRNYRLEPREKLSWKGPTGACMWPTNQNSEKMWEMIMNPGVDGYCKGLIHWKTPRKTQETISCSDFGKCSVCLDVLCLFGSCCCSVFFLKHLFIIINIFFFCHC